MNKNIKGDVIKKINGRYESKYFQDSNNVLKKLNEVSPSFCLAKWYNVSIHLPTGHTHSCYHPPSHKIPLEEISIDVSALHNTKYKQDQRVKMLNGERPSECSFCWQIEDSGNQLSDRAYRSNDVYDDTLIEKAQQTLIPNPRYVEVNFNQSCNFKCSYCSPLLSTAWMDEINKNGAYILEDRWHNDMNWMKNNMPNNSPDNPYVLAFWKWLPQVYDEIQTFRMTGGEPLMDRNTFRMFEYIKANPKKELQLSITSNCCPPGDQWAKFINNINDITSINAIDHFMLFCSLDNIGQQAEYIRNGMNFNVLHDNVTNYLSTCDKHSLTFIITFNVLSYTGIYEYIKYILDLRIQYSTTRQLIWFDIPPLQNPDFLNAKLIPELVSELIKTKEFMECNKEGNNRFKGFKDFEISKMQRLIEWICNNSSFDKELSMKNFYKFFSEHDKRRNTNLLNTFPELTEFWKQCKDLHG
jgi:sulfatase maturation enzyme AslB (radical SAM superfamily)